MNPIEAKTMQKLVLEYKSQKAMLQGKAMQVLVYLQVIAILSSRFFMSTLSA